jgi:hypothetical protein
VHYNQGGYDFYYYYRQIDGLASVPLELDRGTDTVNRLTKATGTPAADPSQWVGNGVMAHRSVIDISTTPMCTSIPPLARLSRPKNSEDPRTWVRTELPGLGDVAAALGLPTDAALRMPNITVR